MDVVKRSIEGLARHDRHFQPGRSRHDDDAAPAADAGDHRMYARAGGRRALCIPLSVVEECIELPASEVTSTAKRNFLDVRGELVPLSGCATSFGTDYPADLFQKIVIVGQGRGRVGLVVDQIIGNTRRSSNRSRFHAGQGCFRAPPSLAMAAWR
jgi:two-component system chemotaxis sensor kinase CheA